MGRFIPYEKKVTFIEHMRTVFDIYIIENIHAFTDVNNAYYSIWMNTHSVGIE